MIKQISYRALVKKKAGLEGEYISLHRRYSDSDNSNRKDIENLFLVAEEKIKALDRLIAERKPTRSAIFHKVLNIVVNTNLNYDSYLERQINGIHFVYKVKPKLLETQFSISLDRVTPSPGKGLFEAERYAENQLFSILGNKIKSLCFSNLLKFTSRPKPNPPNGTLAFWDLRRTGFKIVCVLLN